LNRPTRLTSLALVTAAAFTVTGLIAAPAMAVKPGTWLHQTEADFAAGENQSTIVTNLGEVQLARHTKLIAQLEGDDSIIYDLARIGDRTFLAVGPSGKLLSVDGNDKPPTPLAEFDGQQVFALATDEKGLWVAVSGSPSRLEYRTGKDMAVDRTIELPDIRYVWDMVPVGKMLYVAAGNEGRVLAINTAKADAKPVIALKTGQPNVLSLGADAKGRVYAGTDGEGLIYRITPADNDKFDTFILYDAPEPEIGSLLVMPDGTVFAGTADAEQARPGRLEQAATEGKGRPDTSAADSDKPADIPNVPPKPDPKKPAGSDPAPDTDTDTDGDAKPGSSDKPAKPAPSSGTKDKGKLGAADHAKADPSKPSDSADSGDSAAPATPASKPTAQQYDELRNQVRQRLEQARDSGQIKLQVGKRPGASSNSVAQRLRTRAASGPKSKGGDGDKQGNAVYRIAPDGFVDEVFRESVMILRLAGSGDALLVGTGNEGELYRVVLGAEEVTILADLEPQQIPAMLDLGKGQVLIGTANSGRLIAVSSDFASEGTLTSEALDARQISLFGRLHVTGSSPDGASVAVQTRSGNVQDTDADASDSWSPWSKPAKLDLDSGSSAFVPVTSPAARYLQYRLVLASKGKATPSVNSVSLKYLMPNLQPRISAVKAEYDAAGKADGAGNAPAPRSKLKVEWEAADANGDELQYTLEAAPLGSDGPWVRIAKDLTANDFEWDTRTTPDGRYILRVTASDENDNPPGSGKSALRRSDPVLVDNTPPVIENLKIEPLGKTSVKLTARLTDALSPLTEFRYTIDSDDQWQLVLPEDLIYDSTDETVSVTIAKLAAGRHVVTVRATDALNNSAFVSKTFDLK
jgi:hypothetical protein